MKKRIRNIVVGLSMLFVTLMIGCVVSPGEARAEREWHSPVKETITYTFDDTERSLILLENTALYLKVGEEDARYVGSRFLDFGFDKNGAIWVLQANNTILWYYDVFSIYEDILFKVIDRPTSDNEFAYVDDVESLIFETINGQEFVTGYKTLSGEPYPILTLDEMKAHLGITDDLVQPTPTPTAPSVATPTPTPAGPNVVAPTPTPAGPSVVAPTPTPAGLTVAHPTPTPDQSTSTTISLKKSAGYTCLYKGDTLISKFKIKKSVLTWQRKGKTKSFKGVKKAGFIKKSGTLIFMDKKGKVYTLSSTGKKKTIVKKGAKKLVFEGGFVTKVKKNKGSVAVDGK